MSLKNEYFTWVAWHYGNQLVVNVIEGCHKYNVVKAVTQKTNVNNYKLETF